MRQILLHPGFHKTGTSSIQHFLWTNRAALSPYLTLVMLRHLKPVVRACCRFSRWGNPAELIDFVSQMDAGLAEAGVGETGDVLVSCEGLSGHLPGYPGVDTYAAAPILAETLTTYMAERFPDAQIRLIYTTRDPDTWLYSAWRHHLQGRRLAADFPAFKARFGASADLPAILADIRAALPDVPLHALPLEQASRHPLGPGAALLAEAVIAPGALQSLAPVGVSNAGADRAVWEEFLALNRSDLSDAAVKEAKAQLVKRHKLGGWRKL